MESVIFDSPESTRHLFGEQLISEQIKSDYKKSAAALNKNVKQQLGERKAQLENDIKAIDNELSVKLDELNGAFAALSVEERDAKVKEHKDGVNGAKTVRQRSYNKLLTEYEYDVQRIKEQPVFLLRERNILLATAKGKHSEGHSLGTACLNFKATFNIKKTLTDVRLWKSLAPFIILLVLFLAYVIACNSTGYTMNIDTIITSGIYVAIVAVGAVFIYSQGAFDMSLGNACLVAAACGIMTYSSSHNIVLSFTVCVLLGVLLGVVNAILANCLRLPVMVMTLTMQSVLSAIYSNITSDAGGYIEVPAIRGIGGMTMKWIILIVFVVFCVILFNYTKIGRRSKMIGANATCAKFSGISLMKAGIISFAISGIGLGLCGFLYITQMGSVNGTGTALTTVGLNVIIAINLGGMPTSGGPKSKISAAIIGGFFCVILDELFAALGIALWRYVAKGIIFLVAVCFTSFADRPKRLA